MHVRPLALERRADPRSPAPSRRGSRPARRRRAHRAQLDLGGRLLAGDQEGAPLLRDRAERGQQASTCRRRARRPSTSDAGARPPPSTRSSSARRSRCGRPRRPRRREPEQRARGGGRSRGRPFLDERPERAAARALAEPASRGVPALGACELVAAFATGPTYPAPGGRLRVSFVPVRAQAWPAASRTRSRARRGCTPPRAAGLPTATRPAAGREEQPSRGGWNVSITDVSAAGRRGSETEISSQPKTCALSASAISQPVAESDGVRSRPPVRVP